jgi:Xaa-Pro aminopeptidase
VSGPPLFDPSRLEQTLDDFAAEALLVATAPNVLYLSRYRKGGRALALVRRDEPARPLLVVPASDLDFILEDLVEGTDVRTFGRFHRFEADGVTLSGRDAVIAEAAAAARADADGPALVAEALDEYGITGTVLTDVPATALGRLAEDARLVHRPNAVRRLRMVKTPEELARLSEGARITEAAIEHTNARIRAGARLDELARAFAVAVAEAGSQVRLANISVGPATALGNVNQPDDVVAAETLVRYDVGVVHAGYATDMSRCFSLGAPAEKAARYHEALVAGQAAALETLRAGVRACELFDVAVAAVREAGIPHYDRINVGHGIGLAGDGYDPPLLAPDDHTQIEAGSVLCVETPYYELGFAGLQTEDMVVVTEDGYTPLTHLPRELGVLPA